MYKRQPKEVLRQILRGSNAPQEYIDALKYIRCDDCVLTEKAPKTHRSTYAFNHELHVDCLTIFDMEGVGWQFLSIVDCGTTFHACALVKQGKGTPSSAKCLSKFVASWVNWAGWPKVVTTDRGTHNRGVFGRTLAANGVYVRPIGLESPEQLGRGERHGDIWKWNMKRIIRSHNISSKYHIKIAAAESLSQKNE